jgi:preprotein translocase subunit SecB
MEAQTASFRFDNYTIPYFSFNEPHSEEKSIKLNIIPSGKYSVSEGMFKLELIVTGFEDGESSYPVLDLHFHAYFGFDKNLPFEKIPQYFYKNAIAITFPYIRAFISTLTLQANSGVLILGLMNLSNLEKPLIENTIAE